MRPTKKPRRACGTLRGETAACGPAASGNSDWQEILGEQLFGGITKKCDAWPKGSAGRLPGAFGGWGSVLGLVEHGLALALHPISCCRQHHACAQHQVCQPAAGAGLDQLGILHRREPTPAGTAPSAIADPGRRGHGRPGTSAGCTAGGCRRLPAGRRASPPAGAPGTAMPAAPRCPPHSLFEPVLAASVSSRILRLLCRSPVFFLHYITSAL